MSWRKTIIDRVLRTEGTIAFAQQIWGGIAIALGGGTVTALLTWPQGALSQFGFAGYVVILLLVSIMILVLIEKIADYQDRNVKRIDKFIHLEGAAHIYRSQSPLRSLKEAAAHIVQMAADGSIEITGSKILDRNKERGYPDYGISARLDPTILRHCMPIEINVESVDASIFGGYILSCDPGVEYGMLKINLESLVHSMCRAPRDAG